VGERQQRCEGCAGGVEPERVELHEACGRDFSGPPR
jgi:hypothetical protein